jgi:hypothetical protein
VKLIRLYLTASGPNGDHQRRNKLLTPSKSQTLELGLAKRTKVAAFDRHVIGDCSRTQEVPVLL